MKTQEIIVGHLYHDGKQGLREVLGLAQGLVRYRLLAAKVEQDFLVAGTPRSLIGGEHEVNLSSFSSWAKFGYGTKTGNDVLLGLQSKRVKLSPGEHAFLQSILLESQSSLSSGSCVSYDHMEGRAVAGLERKGMVKRLQSNEVEITPLGSARLKTLALSVDGPASNL